MLLTYFLPLLTMCVIYTFIGRELWGAQPIGKPEQHRAGGQPARRTKTGETTVELRFRHLASIEHITSVETTLPGSFYVSKTFT